MAARRPRQRFRLCDVSGVARLCRLRHRLSSCPALAVARPAHRRPRGARWIAAHRREYDADPERLALIGRSSGAQLAMVSAYAPGAPPVQAVVSYYGPVDLVEGYRHPPTPDPLHVRGIEEAFLGGGPDDVPERYREAFAVTYATRPLPPTLLVYGARDHVVEARFGALLHERLRATGTTSVLLEIPGRSMGSTR